MGKGRILSFALRRPWTVIIAASAGIAAIGALGGLRLRLRTDLAEIVPTAAARSGSLERIDRAFGAGRQAFVIVTAPEPDEARLARFAGRLHFMNLPVLPMVLGVGVDFGIHVVSRHLASGREIRTAFASTSAGLAIATATTMAGFGSLALSENRGLTSIGILCLVGVGSCALAAGTALPAMLALVGRPSAFDR